jgi:hypothetical protein
LTKGKKIYYVDMPVWYDIGSHGDLAAARKFFQPRP